MEFTFFVMVNGVYLNIFIYFTFANNLESIPDESKKILPFVCLSTTSVYSEFTPTGWKT